MTFLEEYKRMRPLEEEALPATVWANRHSRAWDPIPFLLSQAGKASAWVKAEKKFFKGPGSGSNKPSKKKDWPDFAYEQGVCNKAWWEARHLRDFELSVLRGIPWEQDDLPSHFSDWLKMVWAERVPCHQ